MADQEGRLSDAGAPSARLLLVRHGETAWSRDGKHTGRTDVALTEIGERQATELATALRSLTPALVLASPAGRAFRTAQLAGLRNVVVDEDLWEWDYGELEGATTPEIRRRHPAWTVWTGVVPGGETAEQVGRRADRALRRVVSALPSGDVVVVAHGHFNRVLAARWLGLPARDGQLLALDTATVCLLGYEREQRVLLCWNIPGSVAAVAL